MLNNENWICKCGYLIPSKFLKCKDCKMKQHHNYDNINRFQVFDIKKDSLFIEDLIDNYLERQNYGLTKPPELSTGYSL